MVGVYADVALNPRLFNKKIEVWCKKPTKLSLYGIEERWENSVSFLGMVQAQSKMRYTIIFACTIKFYQFLSNNPKLELRIEGMRYVVEQYLVKRNYLVFTCKQKIYDNKNP